jgi:hypothetical protein
MTTVQPELSALIEELNRFSTSETTEAQRIQHLRSIIYPWGISVKYECELFTDKDNVVGLKRVILTKVKGFKHNFKLPIVRQANGAILLHEDGVWSILSIPAPSLARDVSIKKVNIADYEVHKVYDGTIVTMYYYDGAWRYSTVNGYDVGNYKWIGELTFNEVITQSLEASESFSVDALDKNKSYAFGFSHPAFHFFNNGEPFAWFIHSCDSAGNIDRENNDMGISMSETIPDKTMKSILEDCAISRHKYSGAGHYAKQQDERPCLGYVLKNHDGGEFSNILIESPLLKFARQSIYQLKYSSQRKNKVEIDHNNRLEYSLLRLFLRDSDRSSYARYFPQYKSTFDKYTDIFKQLTTMILRACRAANKMHALSQSKDVVDTLTYSMAQLIEQNNDIHVFSDNAATLIYDYITNIAYIDLYYGVLVGARKQE